MKWGHGHATRHDLTSLRLLGTVGEPINPAAWIWYHRHIGGERCPIVDTWWQTETGGIMITPLPGLVSTKPGSATRSFPGVEAEILDGDGQRVGKNHDLKGQAVAAFVTLKSTCAPTPVLCEDLKTHVVKKIGALARPDDIIFSSDLPKTRSGKIMRRLLRDIAEGRALGDTTTLADPAVVEALRERYEEEGEA